jgi:hypothetical protein
LSDFPSSIDRELHATAVQTSNQMFGELVRSLRAIFRVDFIDVGLQGFANNFGSGLAGLGRGSPQRRGGFVIPDEY